MIILIVINLYLQRYKKYLFFTNKSDKSFLLPDLFFL